MIPSLIVEFIGTFIFLSVLIRSYNALYIGLTLTLVILLGRWISGGNYNPAVTYIMLLNDKLDLKTMAMYIVAQILGATAAFIYYKRSN
tara:strand:+ start:3849 stop:4115 length:267 start_codon:yes stop_codon:yes gene_type:complete